MELSGYSEEELRPYFRVPFEMHVETKPPRFSIDFDKLYDAEAARAEMMRRLAVNRTNT